MTSVERVTVHGDRDYDVTVGHGARHGVPAALDPASVRVAVLHAPLVRHWANEVSHALRADGRQVVEVELPDAERAKTAEVLIEAWDQLAIAGFTRSDAVVTVGGGATTDVGGFVAASWLRGVDVVHVPTTTLAMVDAAVGGKTGINIAAGKNLVGAFHPPRAVVVDLDVLAALPLDEHRAGLAEVVKAGFIHDPRILELIEADPRAALDPTAPVLSELIVRAIQVKADVVGADLKETAGAPLSREILNYGHTFGHAIEKVEQYRWRHGDAIAVGMVFAAEVGVLTGHTSPELLDRHRSVLTALNLPTAYGGRPWDELLATMRIDKKARGATLRMVLLDDQGAPVVVPAPGDDVLEAAYRRINA
jgi:3-dehydroquinate synthase